MPITRAKASQLLNQKEMALYDGSRANALRKLDAKALAARIQRARAARDRARARCRPFPPATGWSRRRSRRSGRCADG